MNNAELVERKSGGILGNIASEDVSNGGITSQDLEIPRVLILQALSPDVRDNPSLRPGMVINSITKEFVGKTFIPLLVFKQYAKFDEESKLEWSTVDRNDSRVIDGLEWKEDKQPEVTEFINVLTVWEGDTTTPLILSFKRSSFRTGKQFLTLMALKSATKPLYSFAYELSTKEMQDGQKSWFTPKIQPSKNVVSEGTIEACADMARSFKPLVQKVKTEEVNSEEQPF